MYGFHYNFIERNLDAELLFTDTDSLTYETKSENVYIKNFLSTNICFILATFQKIQSFLMRQIKKVIGKMKDEFDGVIVEEFVGLKSKLHFMKKIDGKEYNTPKGVSIATEFNKFKDVLLNKKILRFKMRRIQSKKHKSGTYEIDKIPLSSFDDKRYVLDDKIHLICNKKEDVCHNCNKKEEI